MAVGIENKPVHADGLVVQFFADKPATHIGGQALRALQGISGAVVNLTIRTDQIFIWLSRSDVK